MPKRSVWVDEATPDTVPGVLTALGAQPLTSTTKVATTSWTPAATDHNKLVAFKDQIAKVVVNLPLNSSVAIPIGFRVEVANFGSTGLEILESTGVVPLVPEGKALRARSQLSKVILTKTGTDEWYVEGDLADLEVGEKTFYEKLMSSAVVWLDADKYDGGNKWKNLGSGGYALDAVLGSANVGWGAWVKDGAFNKVGYNGNYASSPDHAAFDALTSLELVSRTTFGAALTTDTRHGVAKRNTGQWTWDTAITNAGTMQLYLSLDGTAFYVAGSTANLSLIVGTTYWFKSDWRNSDGRVRHFYAVDSVTEPSTWTQLGTDVILSSTIGATLFNGTALVEVGSIHGGLDSSVVNRSFKRAIVRNGIAGTTVFDADFTTLSDGVTSFTESTGKVVTINRTQTSLGYGYGTFIGNGALNLPGVNVNCASTPDSAALNFSAGLEVVARIALDDWTPSSGNVVLSQNDNISQRSFRVGFVAGGAAFVAGSSTGSAWAVNSSIAVFPTVADGEFIWYRWTFTPDVSGFAKWEVSWAPDSALEPSAWTILGSRAIEAAHTLFNSTEPLRVGHGSSGSDPFAGKIKRVIARNAPTAGATVFDADFSTQPDGTTSFRESSSNAAVVTVVNSSANTNAPLWLHAENTGYVYYPGSIGNYARAAHGGSTVATSIRFEVKVSFSRTGNTEYMCGWDSTHAALYKDADEKLRAYVLTSGTPLVIGNAISSPAIPYTVGVPIWLAGEVDIATAACRYYYSLDTNVTNPSSVTWTQLGVQVIGSNAGATPRTIQPYVFGTYSGGITGMVGNLHAASMFKDGVRDISVDFSTITEANQSTFVCSTGQTVTFNRSASGRKLVVMPGRNYGGKSKFLLGTDDYFEIPDNALLDFGASDSMTALIVLREFQDGVSYPILLSKSDANDGWELSTHTTTKDLFGSFRETGSTDVFNSYLSGASPSFGTQYLAGLIADRSNNTGKMWANGVIVASGDMSAVGDMTTSFPFAIGKLGVGGNYASMECVAVAILRRPCTTSELSFISSRNGAAA